MNSFSLTGIFFLEHPVYSKYNTSLYLILGGKFWFTHVPVTCNKTRVSSNRVHVANLSWVESAVWCVKMSKIWIEGLNVVAGDHSPHFTILKKNIFIILQKNIFSFNNKILSESNNKILSDCHHKSFLIFMIHRFITRSWTKNEGL